MRYIFQTSTAKKGATGRERTVVLRMFEFEFDQNYILSEFETKSFVLYYDCMI